MTPDDTFILLPAGVALVFLLIGLVVSWRVVVGFVLSGYASIVISSQHNAFIASLIANYVSVPNATIKQQSAVAFVITFATLFIAVSLLYIALWRPALPRSSQQEQSALMRLLRGALGAILGWGLGAVLVICILVILPGRLVSTSPSYVDAIHSTAEVTISLAEPWLVTDPPLAFSSE